ncbi:hypothetical protein [Inquilinus sp. CA228]|uniref:hypothetical protein n=1 Tax=Inquilinus sp. CA228 TaxID=3455609 RepID=UPI003F8D3131
MSTLDPIRAAIVALAQTVPDVGIVHDRERYASNPEKLRALYVPAGSTTIKGWYVRRVSTQETSGAIGRWEIIHRWRLRGFRGFVDDAGSEKAFDDVIEAMRDAFRDDETLGGTVITTVVGAGDSAIAGLQVDEAGSVMFANALCHAATLTLYTRHYE